LPGSVIIILVTTPLPKILLGQGGLTRIAPIPIGFSFQDFPETLEDVSLRTEIFFVISTEVTTGF
jgi:hypothetical protein